VFLVIQTLLNGLSSAANYALLAVGLSLVYGILNIANFAHGLLFALGGYSAVMLTTLGLPYFVVVPLAVAATCVLAWLMEAGVVRPLLYSGSHHLSIIVTAALAQAGVAVINLAAGADPISLPSPVSETMLRVGPFFIAGQRALSMAVAICVLLALGAWLTRTTGGRQVLAVSQNPRGALYAGINVSKVRTTTFILGAACAALAGVLIGPETTVNPNMGTAALVAGFTVVVLGGMGSIRGALLSALVMGLLNAFSETYLSARWAAALAWMVVVVVLLVRPQGIAGRVALHRY
jgi:branched-chain amino acid transport system permease protein